MPTVTSVEIIFPPSSKVPCQVFFETVTDTQQHPVVKCSMVDTVQGNGGNLFEQHGTNFLWFQSCLGRLHNVSKFKLRPRMNKRCILAS